ncbi:MAG: YggS family pyridoxal phosphate-dependent enzyme, partial [Bryobacteraceae bacterium]
VLADKLEKVEERIERAAARAGRKREDITLVAVTKKFEPNVIREAFLLGIRDFGENYVQEFQQKEDALSDLLEARFHFIGHLQGNKARNAAELFDVIETLDSAKLAQRLNGLVAQGSGDMRLKDVMLEVKLSDEEAKAGVAPEDLPALIEAVRACSHLNLIGLMTMPPWSEKPEPSRPFFKQLAALAQEHGLTGLSMGMSHDLEVAIEEGATHIRVGTALFGARPKPKTAALESA